MNQATIDKHSHRLNPDVPDPTADQYWQAAADFVNACCWDERTTYRLILKTDSGHCWSANGPVVCDKITDITSSKMYDMVGAAGSANQTPIFEEVTGQTVAPDIRVNPYDYTLPPLEAIPPPMTSAPVEYPPYPGDEAFLPLGNQLFADYDLANKTPDPGMSTWYGRVIYDWLTGLCPSLEASIAKHQNEWRYVLGLPPIQQPSVLAASIPPEATPPQPPQQQPLKR